MSPYTEKEITETDNNKPLLNFLEYYEYNMRMIYKSAKSSDKNSIATKNSKTKFNQAKELVNSVKNYPYKIRNGEQIKHIKGVGEQSINMINEIIETRDL